MAIAMDDRQELLDKIGEHVTEQQLDTIKKSSASETDEIEFLNKVLSKLQGATHGVIPDGYSIVEKISLVYDERTNQPAIDVETSEAVTEHLGYVIKHESNGDGMPSYCGTVGDWRHKIEYVPPFESRDSASSFLNLWIALQGKRTLAKQVEIPRQEVISLPAISVPKPEKHAKVGLNLNVEQAHRLKRWQAGLVATHAKLRDGSPVSSMADVVRFICEK